MIHSKRRARSVSAAPSGRDPTENGPFGEDTSQVQTEKASPIVGYLLVEAASFNEATEIAQGCPGLEHGFGVDVCRPFIPARNSEIRSTNRS